MASKFGAWRQKIQHQPSIAIGILVLLITFLAFALAVHWWGWGWTGFGPYFAPPRTTVSDFPRGRTLWDWLDLLIIPLMLGIGGFWLNELDKNRDKRAAEQRDKIDREIAADHQQEAALQAYLDKMSELLLEKKLRDSAEEDEVRTVARARTMVLLHRLDAIRKAHVIRGLHEFGLIDKEKCLVSLNGADLRGAPLVGAILRGVSLAGADLSRAFLSRTHLSKADLSGATLSGATLEGAILREVTLVGANLSRAFLSGTHLSKANLSKANLSGATLEGANLSEANLEGAIGVIVEELEKQAASLKGATMPDGSTHS